VRSGLAVARRVLAAAWAGGPGGPVVLAHADVHAENAFELGRDEAGVALALIDLDRVGLAPVGLDLAFALLDHADATAWACLRGYRSVADLDDAFEGAYAAFRLLATVDNLAFLGGIEHEHRFVAAAWPGLVAVSAALASTDSPPDGVSTGAGGGRR
jgi:Ser/Thr protein kinase RdoA (MazF antagonist)